jgi:hypothetical protein
LAGELMKKLSLVLVLLAFGCQNSDSKSAPSKSEEEKIMESSATDVTQTVRPNDFQILKSDISLDEFNERYSDGCKMKGHSEADYAVDPSLRTGMTSNYQQGNSTVYGAGSSLLSTETKIVNIYSDRVFTETNYTDMTVNGTRWDPSTIFKGTPHSTAENFIDQNGHQDWKVILNVKDGVIQENDGVSWSCYLTSSNSGDSDSKSTYNKISYNLGRPVVAYELVTVSTGNIVCEKYRHDNDEVLKKINLGAGTEVRRGIYSNDLVSFGLSRCGGNNIYHSSLTKLNSGKVVESYANKIVTGPIR